MFRRSIDDSIIESINSVTEVRNMITLLADNIKAEGKQNTLIRQLNKKFGLVESEVDIIIKCSDTDKLDLAIDDILFVDNKQSILKNLQ